MNIFEIIRMAYASLTTNKLRSLLTMFAIVVGVFAIISASTAVLVLQTYFDNTLNVMGGNVVFISKYPGVMVGGDYDKYRNRKNITFDDFEKLKERVVLARSVSPNEQFTSTKVEYDGTVTDPDIQVYGSNEYYISNNAYNIKYGRDLNQSDVTSARSVCLIGSDVVDKLFPTVYPVGKKIRIGGRPFTVIGTVESKGSTFGESQDKFVLIPYTRAIQIYGSDRNISIQARSPSMTLVPATIDELIGLMRTIRKVPPGKDNDFNVETNNSLKEAFSTFTGYLYLFGFVVGGIALLGAGIGVMNIMLVSVTERTREIGIRKALGATRKAIIYQFLIEAVFICQLGGIIGFLIGVLGGNILAVVMDSQLVFPWLAAIGGIAGLSLIGLAFGVFPATKAARLDPVESLRYE